MNNGKAVSVVSAKETNRENFDLDLQVNDDFYNGYNGNGPNATDIESTDDVVVEAIMDVDTEFDDLHVLEKEPTVDVKLIDEAESEIMDEHDGWMFESTMTDLPLIDLKGNEQDGRKEPAWRILERRREEKALRDSLGDDLFLDS